MYCNPDLQTPYFFMFSFLERPNTTYNKKGGPIPQSVLQAAGQISWCGTMCWSRFCRSGCRRDRPGPNQRGSRRDAQRQTSWPTASLIPYPLEMFWANWARAVRRTTGSLLSRSCVARAMIQTSESLGSGEALRPPALRSRSDHPFRPENREEPSP